jgi:hypothetical protein
MTDMTDDDERAAIRGELLATLRATAPKMAAKLDDHWRQEGSTVQMPVDPAPRICDVCGEKIKARAETSGRFRTVNWVDSGGSIAGPDPITGPDPYGRLAELADTDPAAYMYLLTRVEQGFTLHVHRPAPTERTYPSDRS